MEASNQTAKPQVTIYTSPGCAYCHMAKEYFEDKNISYAEKDVTTDQEAFNFITQKIGQAVTPIITIGDAVIIGFDRPKIDTALTAI